jgi:polyisoprenoid-binding protein YceI
MNTFKRLLLPLGAIVLIGGGCATAPKAETPTALETAPVPAAVVSSAKDGVYAFGSEHSVVWEGRKILIPGYKDTGTLGIKEGSVTIAGGKVTGGKIVFDMATLEVKGTGKGKGEPMLQKHLKSPDFFDAEKFPTIEFAVTEVVPAADAATTFMHAVKGNLTIKGITKPHEFSAKIYDQDGAGRVEGSMEIDRTLWDVRYGSGKFFKNLADNVIDDNFTVKLDLTARAAQ